jgi:uncharacterized DUF497 family protein
MLLPPKLAGPLHPAPIISISVIDLLSQWRIFSPFESGVDYLEIYDEEHSDDEDRFIAVGPISRGIVVVAYTERDDDVLRILSARMATKKERQRYRSFEGEKDER